MERMEMKRPENDRKHCDIFSLLKRAIAVLCMAALITGTIAVLPSEAAGGTKVKMKIGKKTFNAVIYNNKTGKALLKKMPVRYKMKDLNGNEKYKYLSFDLPVNEKKVKKIKAGDIMLYGSDCLVVFYKSFKTQYEYTRVGRISNIKGLRKAAGKGTVAVKIYKKKKK